MGNDCCRKMDEEPILKTLENDSGKNDKNENTNDKRDKYPHDTDSAFKSVKKIYNKDEIKPISSGNIIEE